jgi:hypothetical protein
MLIRIFPPLLMMKLVYSDAGCIMVSRLFSGDNVDLIACV